MVGSNGWLGDNRVGSGALFYIVNKWIFFIRRHWLCCWSIRRLRRCHQTQTKKIHFFIIDRFSSLNQQIVHIRISERNHNAILAQ